MRTLFLATLSTALLASAAYAAYAPEPVSATPRGRAIVLILVDGLTWNEVERTPGLRETFRDGAVANLSTAQGARPADSRMGYVFLGAGARVDTAVLPPDLPDDPRKVTGAFEGPASTVRPGALGDALAEAGVRTAALGEHASLVVMDGGGNAPSTKTSNPVSATKASLDDGAGFLAVEAAGPEQAGRISAAALQAGATTAVASPNAPPDSPNLTPFALSGSDGLLYSPATRTKGLISNADVAPTLLTNLGIEPPDGMQGRAATVRPGTLESAERLGDRLAFVAEKRLPVWGLIGTAGAAALALGALWKGRTGVYTVLLTLAALPAGALLAAAVPITNALAVAAITLLLAAALAGVCQKLSGPVSGALAGVCLASAALVAADAAAGGALMKLSTLGYNPAYGARFYGAGNEYSAVLAGSLAMGLGALAHGRRVPAAPVAGCAAATVLVLGLPTMGADVGGSLALGSGLGATIGLVRGDGPRRIALWAGGGLFLAALVFLTSGILFPDVSHGSRAAGGEGGLAGIAVRKLLLSLEHLFDPLLLLLLMAGSALVYAGWRRTRGTALAAGMLGAAITAAASGALNDSGIIATLFALAYPATAALRILLEQKGLERR